MKKIISFELKKLVSRIGIYILAILLAGLLVASVFMYDPIERNTTPLSLTGATVTEMHDNFTNDIKQNYIDNVESISTDAETYISTSPNYQKSNNKKEIDNIFEQLDDYCLLYNESTATSAEYDILLEGIRLSLIDLNNALDEGLNPCSEQNGYYILTTNNNYSKLYSTLNKTITNFNNVASHTLAGEKYFNELRAPLYDCLQNLVYPSLQNVASKYAVGGTYYTLITSRMDEISQKIDQELEKVVANPTLEQNKDIKNELNVLFNRYANCVEIFTTSYNSSMCVEALNTVTNKSKRANLFGYSEVSLYEMEETAVQYQYYIENHASSSDFANSLSVTHTSNGKKNAYDFTFFVMSLFAVVVMLFVIYLSSHTIAGEINNNTMRLTALRPIKRSSVLLGKYFAILIMAFILLLFGTITSMIVGGVMFGIDSANILMIVNGNLIFATHPAVAIIIFVLSLLLIMALYSALTMVLSCWFKSDALAMIVSVMIYSVNLILPLFFGINSWLKFYPLANINLFAYFGTTRLTSDSILAKLFNNVVYHGMNIWISLIYVIGITTILLLIAKHLFKKKEL